MKKSLLYNSLKTAIQKIDWKLLLFLLLFLDVKMIVKIFAVIIIYLLRFNFRFSYKTIKSRLPWFYIIVIAIAFLNLMVYKLYPDSNYDIAFITGISFWLLCILAVHQIKLSVENSDTQIIHNTLIAFFAINVIVSFGNLLQIIIETGAINPYRYQGLFQKYFIGTGDNIRGVSFDTSTTNAIINAFGVIYFLKRKELLMVLLCMIILLLTASNVTNILILAALTYMFIFKSTREQKSMIAICFFLFVIFMAKISPQNNEYAEGLFKRFLVKKENTVVPAKLDTSIKITQTPQEQKQKQAKDNLDSEYYVLQKQKKVATLIPRIPVVKPSVPVPNINSREYQNPNDTTQLQRELISFAKQKHLDSAVFNIKDNWHRTPGKFIAMKQTWLFLKQHPWKIFTGDGIGNFSSKLAFRVAALKIAGSYPAKYVYINNDFLQNHLVVFLYYFTKQAELHSIANTPDSTYNQLAGEYGLAGFVAFLVFYIGFFMKSIKTISEAVPFLFIMMAAFGMGYWFEQLSIVPVFELLMFLHIKENEQTTLR
jgi:hypothetical protein